MLISNLKHLNSSRTNEASIRRLERSAFRHLYPNRRLSNRNKREARSHHRNNTSTNHERLKLFTQRDPYLHDLHKGAQATNDKRRGNQVLKGVWVVFRKVSDPGGVVNDQ